MSDNNTHNFVPDPEWQDRELSNQLENNYWSKQDTGQIESEDAPEPEKEPELRETAKAVKGGPGDYSWGGYEEAATPNEAIKPANVSQEDWDSRPKWTKPLEDIVHAGSLPALGVLDTLSDAVGLVPWLKPIDQWWDKNSPRHSHPAYKMTRDAASVIIPSVYGGHALSGIGKTRTAGMAIPSAIRTLGTAATYAGVDTAVAMVSSHSKTDDNLAATLNNWLGWNIPWATREGDSPDVRWKKNVYESAGLSGGIELLGVAFHAAKKARLLPRDTFAQKAVAKRQKSYTRYDNPLTSDVESAREARQVAQRDEMIRGIEADPEGTKYNPFINDLGPDDANRAVINTQPDPLLSKVHQVQIQQNLGTSHGRAAAVVDETFNRDFLHAIDGNERAKQLDNLFEQISPNVDAVVNGKTISAEQMNRAVDNLTNAVLGRDLPLNEFEFILDDMRMTVNQTATVLDAEQHLIAQTAFKNAYEKLFDPNQMRASAMLTQQAGDNIADAASAVKMLGEQVDTTRQMNIIFDKLNLLGQEVQVNQYIVSKAKEYQKLKTSGNIQEVFTWLQAQGDEFDNYVKQIKQTGGELNQTLKEISTENPEYYRAFVEAFDATNGKVDSLYKLKQVAENNVAFLRKGIIDFDPENPSMLIKQLHAARIHGLLGGLAPARAVIGNSMLTAIKPVSVFAGAYLQGKPAALKRALYTYGGISENFKRGIKVMRDEWALAMRNPEEAMMRGRADLRTAQLDQLSYMDKMADGWRASKEQGWQAKTALWNMTKFTTWWNKQAFVRWGTNALYAIDGMTNSFMASGVARARAYDELFERTKGAFDLAEFNKRQRQIYNEMFDEAGNLTDEAAKHASQEIALNMDNATVKRFEDFLDSVPAAKGLFLFPRTGVNALELAWTFNPLSGLGLAMPKMRRVLSATSKAEKIAALAEHGIKESNNIQLAFDTLKSEYIGRQIMGGTIVTAAGMWALEGNMTGAGPQDGAERQRMTRMGWRPFSIKNPITGEWRSYEGFEPFAQLLGLTSDIVYHANRVDQGVTEDWFRKLSYSISMNVTNNTFVSGFEPLADLLSGDPTGWARFWANQVDQTIIPFRGVRSILNNAISPQLRDVNNDILSYLANANKFIVPDNEDGALPNLLDVYTGKPIRGYESITQAANAVLPFFKQNGDMAPWRQWLLATGWDGLQRLKKNKYTGEPLSQHDRHFINNWIAENAGLQQQVISLMTQNDGYWDKKMKEFKKLRGEVPVKQWIVHKELDRMHDLAYENAWNALEAYNAQYTTQGRLLRMRNYELQKGRGGDAIDTQKKIQQLQKIRK